MAAEIAIVWIVYVGGAVVGASCVPEEENENSSCGSPAVVRLDGWQTDRANFFTHIQYTYARILLKKKKLVEHNSSHPGF